MWHRLYRLSSASLATLANEAADLLFPWRCAGCERVGSPFCAYCAQRVEPSPKPGCPRCGAASAQAGFCAVCRALVDDPLAFARSATQYTGVVRSAIHNLKYGNVPAIAPLLARYLVVAFARPEWDFWRSHISAIAPVPLHAQRLAERGYNQSELLARSLSRSTGIPLDCTSLTRVRNTRPQVGLNAAERRENIFASFHADATVAGQTLLLVDDVFTTGATLRDCAAAAMASGAQAVVALTLSCPVTPFPDGDVHHMEHHYMEHDGEW